MHLLRVFVVSDNEKVSLNNKQLKISKTFLVSFILIFALV